MPFFICPVSLVGDIAAVTKADKIREFVAATYIGPAREAARTRVSFLASDIHKGLGLVNRYPAVCDAIDRGLFAQQNRLRLVSRKGPRLGSTVRWTFEIRAKSPLGEGRTHSK